MVLRAREQLCSWCCCDLAAERRQKLAAVIVDLLQEQDTHRQTRPAQLANGAVLPVDSKAEAAFARTHYGVSAGDPPGSEGWVCQLKLVPMAYPDGGSSWGHIVQNTMPELVRLNKQARELQS